MRYYVKEPTGTVGVVDTALPLSELCKLYPPGTAFSETPFPEEATEAPTPAPKPKKVKNAEQE